VHASAEDGLISESFAPHPYVIVAPPDHPLAGKKHIPLKEVLKYSFITREAGSETCESMHEVFADNYALV